MFSADLEGTMAFPSRYTGPGTASVPQAAPAAPPVSSVQAGGYTPDYGALIKSDPSYVASQSAARASEATASAQRKQALQQAVIQYGGLPAGFTDTYGDVGKSTLDQAGQNQFSTLANLHDNYQKSLSQFRSQLSARGALQSGDLNYGQDQLTRGYGQQQYDAGNQFGDRISQALNSYSGVVGQNARDVAQGVQSAGSNLLQNPAYQPVAPFSAQYDASSSARYGRPVYVGPDGKLYDSNGQEFNAAAAQPSPGFVDAYSRSGGY